jgi:hypothetical protein
MRGTRPFYEQSVLIEFLQVLEQTTSFAPERWSGNERGSLPYSRSEIQAMAAREGGEPLFQADVFVRRSKVAKYECRLVLSEQPGFELELNPALQRQRWGALFELSDRLANVCRPDWGATHIWYESREPWANDDDRDNELMFRSALLAPVDYYDHGPRGLVMRTFIGPHYVTQFGEELVRSAPLLVTALPWGGYRVDLISDPWKANVAQMLPAWREGMEHFRSAEVLAVPEIRDGQLIGYKKGPRCTIGGTTHLFDRDAKMWRKI